MLNIKLVIADLEQRVHISLKIDKFYSKKQLDFFKKFYKEAIHEQQGRLFSGRLFQFKALNNVS